MTQFLSRPLTLSVFCVFALFVCGARAQADDISGTINTALVLHDDSELSGDVTCAVSLTSPGANPCISFGADHIKLRLNGHTITGPVTPPTGCSHEVDAMFGVGIAVLDRSDVKIEGPGIIQHFERWGILVGLTGHPNSEVTVKKVTADHNCWSGMQTFSTSDSNFEENVFASDSGGSNGAGCGGAWMVSSKHNRVRLDTFYGNGSATSKASSSTANSNNFGLGLFGASQNNLVEKNKIGGNINGLYLGGGGNVIGNIIRRNVILGNPPAEAIREFGDSIGADIQDFSAPGKNTFDGNRCLSYSGAGPSPCPNVGNPNDEDAEQEAVAAFVRNRLASQSRVFNAVYRLNSSRSNPWV